MIPSDSSNLPNQINIMFPDSAFREEPDQESARTGPVPLDTYPVQWFNFLWNQQTTQQMKDYLTINSILAEIWTVLDEAGISPDDTVSNQLLRAIKAIIVATQTDGSTTVVSSDDADKVSINSNNKTMTVNALTDIADLNGTTVVEAVNANTAKLTGLTQNTVQEAIDAVDVKINSNVYFSDGVLYITDVGA